MDHDLDQTGPVKVTTDSLRLTKKAEQKGLRNKMAYKAKWLSGFTRRAYEEDIRDKVCKIANNVKIVDVVTDQKAKQKTKWLSWWSKTACGADLCGKVSLVTVST